MSLRSFVSYNVVVNLRLLDYLWFPFCFLLFAIVGPSCPVVIKLSHNCYMRFTNNSLLFSRHDRKHYHYGKSLRKLPKLRVLHPNLKKK